MVERKIDKATYTHALSTKEVPESSILQGSMSCHYIIAEFD